jgi:hypothetical protein
MTDAPPFVDQGQDSSSQSQSPYIVPAIETAKNSPFACNVCKKNYSASRKSPSGLQFTDFYSVWTT